MADYSTLKEAIRAAIYDNVTQAITGDKLQEILLEMVDELGQSYVKPAAGIPWSDLNQQELAAMTEEWTFTLADGTTVTKKVLVLP